MQTFVIASICNRNAAKVKDATLTKEDVLVLDSGSEWPAATARKEGQI